MEACQALQEYGVNHMCSRRSLGHKQTPGMLVSIPCVCMCMYCVGVCVCILCACVRMHGL